MIFKGQWRNDRKEGKGGIAHSPLEILKLSLNNSQF